MSLGITWLDAIVWGVITFSLLIVAHEGGHFLAARLFRVRVHEFMVGLPGPALSFRSERTGTRFGVTAVPLGGYVRIAGMEPGPEDALLADALDAVIRMGGADAASLARVLGIHAERAAALLATLVDWGAVTDADDGRHDARIARVEGEDAGALLARARAGTYRALRTWQRVVLLSAGVVTNVIVAMLVLAAVISVAGDPRPTLEVAQVSAGAAVAGVQPGDRITAFDGAPVEDFAALAAASGAGRPGQVVTLDFERDGVARSVRVELTDAAASDGGIRPILGIAPRFDYGPVPVGEAVMRTFALVGLVVMAIVSFFNPGTFPTAVQGARSIIGASTEIAYAVDAGPADYAALVALLSLSLGLMNVLPIPPLDGGKIVIELLERVLGRPLKREVSLAISAAGALLLFSLIGYLMYADVVRITNG